MGANRRRLQDQLAGLGNRHEVARDFRVGNGHRPTLADLLAEQRHDAAGGIQDIAEAHGDEACTAMIDQRLANHLAQALGRAQDVARIHRLVSGDQDEGSDIGRAAGAGDGLGGEHVVAHCFTQLGFQQRYLLVGRSVEYRFRLGGAQRIFDNCGISAIAQHRDVFQVGKVPAQAGQNGDQCEFVVLDQGNATGTVAGTLAAQLGADRATSAGDQHRARTEPAADRLPVRQHLLASEKVLDCDLLQLARQ